MISLLSPLGEGRGPSTEQTWIPSTQGCFVLSLVEICQVVLEKKSKIGKVYRQTDRQTDNGRQVIRKAHLSFQLRWAKKATKSNLLWINKEFAILKIFKSLSKVKKKPRKTLIFWIGCVMQAQFKKLILYHKYNTVVWNSVWRLVQCSLGCFVISVHKYQTFARKLSRTFWKNLIL